MEWAKDSEGENQESGSIIFLYIFVSNSAGANESFELITSHDLKNWRVYMEGEYILHRSPKDLEPGVLHGGLEHLGPTQILGIGRFMGGVNLKSFEEYNWSLDVSYKNCVLFFQVYY